jgi:hypothetical protein
VKRAGNESDDDNNGVSHVGCNSFLAQFVLPQAKSDYVMPNADTGVSPLNEFSSRYITSPQLQFGRATPENTSTSYPQSQP